MGRNITIWNGWTKTITFNPDSRNLMSGESYSADVRQWGVPNGGEITAFGMKLPCGCIYAIATSMDGRWIVTGDSEKQVIVWDAVTRTIAKQISEHTGVVYAVDVSGDSMRIASGSADSTVRIFSIISGVRVIHPLELANAGAPTAVKFSPDGSRVATATQTLVGIYDTHSGNKLINIPVQNTSSLTWSFDGQQLLFSSLGKLTCFDGSTSSHFKLAWFINHDSDNYNDNNTTSVVTYGRFVACATGLWVSFWDYASGKLIGSIVEHATTVNCISISPDGKYLACGHQQGTTVHHLADVLPGHYLRIPRVPRILLLQLDDPVLEPWALGNLTDALSMLSKEIESAQDSNPGYHAHTLAARSIVRARLREWKTAIEDAEMSLQINQSPIGQIARSLALVGAGKQEIALDDFDLAFRNDPGDTTLLLIIKSIFVFICGKRKEASSRLHTLLTTSDEKTRGYYTPVLGNMYLKLGDYESAVQTLVLSKNPPTSQDSNPLMTITLIFDWNFDHLEDIACQRLCELWYSSGRIKEIGEILLKMVSGLTDDEKEPAHGRILEELVTRSGQVTLLIWTGKSSRCNSCLPSSPAVYSQKAFVPPRIEPVELEKRIVELRAILPHVDAMVIYDRITRLQPVRFSHSRLLLPCIVYTIKRLRKGKGKPDHWNAETAEFGNVEFTTADSLPFKAPRRLVFADLRLHSFRLESAPEWNSSDVGNSVATSDVHVPMIEEVPLASEPQLDTYTRALRLIARLRQPFSALLLLRQSNGSYKRVAADQKIVIRGTENFLNPSNLKDIRVEVLEIF